MAEIGIVALSGLQRLKWLLQYVAGEYIETLTILQQINREKISIAVEIDKNHRLMFCISISCIQNLQVPYTFPLYLLFLIVDLAFGRVRISVSIAI